MTVPPNSNPEKYALHKRKSSVTITSFVSWSLRGRGSFGTKSQKMLLPKIEGKFISVSVSASYILSTVHTHEEVFQIDVDRTGYFQPEEVNYDVLSCPHLHSFKFTPICQKDSGQLISVFHHKTFQSGKNYIWWHRGHSIFLESCQRICFKVPSPCAWQHTRWVGQAVSWTDHHHLNKSCSVWKTWKLMTLPFQHFCNLKIKSQSQKLVFACKAQ